MCHASFLVLLLDKEEYCPEPRCLESCFRQLLIVRHAKPLTKAQSPTDNAALDSAIRLQLPLTSPMFYKRHLETMSNTLFDTTATQQLMSG